MSYEEILNHIVYSCKVCDGYNGKLADCQLAFVDGIGYEVYHHGYQRAVHINKDKFSDVNEFIGYVKDCRYYVKH